MKWILDGLWRMFGRCRTAFCAMGVRARFGLPDHMNEFAMIFRLTYKLNARIKGGTLATLPTDENPFADWSAALFQVGRLRYILVTNTKSLYSTVLPGNGVTDEVTFVRQFSSSVRELLEANGHRGVYERSIAPLLGTVRFAKALNRSITGSMNDLVRMSVHLLEQGELSLAEISTYLTGIPMTGLKHDKSTHGFPRDVFNTMVKTAEIAR